MADLSALKELCQWMREEKILYARCGDLELRLSPAPVSPSLVDDPSPLVDEERETLSELLWSSCGDVDAILNLTRKAG